MSVPREWRLPLQKLAKKRVQLEKLSAEVAAEQRELALLLTDRLGLSMSDAGELLGVTKQRVHQWVRGR